MGRAGPVSKGAMVGSEEATARPREAAAAQNGNNDGTHADDEDNDVILEWENSAWDVLEARFKRNAQEGNYFDLTDDRAGNAGKALSVADAERAFAAMRRSEHASSSSSSSPSSNGGATDATTGRQTDSAIASTGAGNDGSNNLAAAANTEPSTTRSAPSSPIISALNAMIHDTITELQQPRALLLAVMQGQQRRGQRQPAALLGLVYSIQRRTRRIQTFVNRNADAVTESTSAVERLEKMNLLVLKANALINAVNDKLFGNTRSTNANRKRKGEGSGGGGNGSGGSGGGSNEVIVIE